MPTSAPSRQENVAKAKNKFRKLNAFVTAQKELDVVQEKLKSASPRQHPITTQHAANFYIDN